MNPQVQRDLRADCSRCAGLCCVAPAFAKSADFAINKPAGKPCKHLAADFSCGIHTRLRPKGFTGCAVFDCLGAGQRVIQETYGGRDWRSAPELAGQMFAVFAVVRRLHELLWYLTEALTLPAAEPHALDLGAALEMTADLAEGEPGALLGLDLDEIRGPINVLLSRSSELARAGFAETALNHRGADLVGVDLRHADLRGANLRGAYLIGSDLRGCDLQLADFTGADIRGADLRGADLGGSLFLLQSQLDAARGDAATRIPTALSLPGHWAAR